MLIFGRGVKCAVLAVTLGLPPLPAPPPAECAEREGDGERDTEKEEKKKSLRKEAKAQQPQTYGRPLLDYT